MGGALTLRFCCGFCDLSSESDHLLSFRRYLGEKGDLEHNSGVDVRGRVAAAARDEQRLQKKEGGGGWAASHCAPWDAAGESGLGIFGGQRCSS